MQNIQEDLNGIHKRELNELSISYAIRSFGLALISIFIPVYLISIGFGFREVLLFFAVFTGMHALLVIPSYYFVRRFGTKKSILFAAPFLVITMLLIIFLNYFTIPLAFIGISYGISSAFFWTGFHTDFVVNSNKKKRGSQIGAIKILVAIAEFLAPLIGGIVITIFGFNTITIISLIILMIAPLPLFFSKENNKRINGKISIKFNAENIRKSLTMVGYGMDQNADSIIWPIFIFFAFLGNSYELLGVLGALKVLISIFVIKGISRVCDKQRTLTMKFSFVIGMFVWAIRLIISKVYQIFAIDSIGSFINKGKVISLDAISYDDSKESVANWIVLREVSINGGACIFFLISILINNIFFSLIFGGIFGSLLLLLSFNKKEGKI